LRRVRERRNEVTRDGEIEKKREKKITNGFLEKKSQLIRSIRPRRLQ
jgi:hypothetical protein